MRKILLISMFIYGGLYASDGLLNALALASSFGQNQKVGSKEFQALLDKESATEGVVAIPVLQQGFKHGWPKGDLESSSLTWDDISVEDGGNCGYHALKNTLFLMNAIEKKEAQYLKFLTSKKAYFDCMAFWGPMIYERRLRSAHINWLGGEEIDYLIHDLKNLLALPDFSELDTNVNIVTIEHIHAIDAPINETVLEEIRNIAEAQNGMLGVVWTAEHSGHWVSFVLCKKAGHLKIYYMNSCNHCLPLFKEAVRLFSLSADEIDGLIKKNKQTALSENLGRMELNLDVLLGENNENIAIYQYYVGCIKRSSSMKKNFSKQDIKNAGFDPKEIDYYAKVVNDAWKLYLKKQIAQKNENFRQNYIDVISQQRERVYGFWINKNDKKAFVVNIDNNDCPIAQAYNTRILLLSKAFEVSFFDPAENLEFILSQIFISWAEMDKSLFDKSIQEKIEKILAAVLDCYKTNPNLFKAIDKQAFRVAKTQRFFSDINNPTIHRMLASIKHVMDNG